MIEPFIRALKQAGVQADDRQLAEILWLIRFMSGPLPTTLPSLPTPELESPPPSPPGSPPSAQTEARSHVIRSTPDVTTPVYAVPSTGAGRQPLAGRKVRVSGAAALPAALEIARALRPFSRRYPSRQRFVFDEAATVRNAAEGGPLIPIRRPARERWFEVALVVEDTPTMAVWRQTLVEWQRLLTVHGAFRDIRRWRLRLSDGILQLMSQAGVIRPIQQLREPSGRRLILVASDCVSPGWRDGTMATVMAEWGANLPVAIVQMLPSTLWRHTALGASSLSLHTVLPGAPNAQLTVTRPWWDLEPPDRSVALPVLTLEPEVVSA